LALLKVLVGNKFDLLHSQGYTAGILGVFINSVFHVPHIITLHRTFGEGQFSNTFWDEHTLIKKRLIEFMLSKADIIQTVSYDAQENLLEYFPGLRKKAKKIVVIRNGINTNQFEENAPVQNKPIIRESGKFTIGFLGRYMPEKGFPYLIETVDRLVNEFNKTAVKVVSVGGFGGFIREYQKEINDKGLTSYFKFLGFFDNVAPILREIDLLVIPSLGEACPLVPMEALVCGTPVIAFSCNGLSEVLMDTPAIMVPVKDSEGMAKEIIRIMENYEYVKNNFDNFATRAKERFDVTITVNKLRDLFADLTSKRQATSMYFKK